MTGWMRAALSIAVVLVAIAAPAEARRFRFGLGGTGQGERIEKVAELPDRDPYLHDGKEWNLGWFYSRYKVAGITTSSAYEAGRFVLYSGRRYVLLDDEQLALIARELGEDPTLAFRAGLAETAARSRARAEADAASLKDNLIERRPGESIAAYRDRARAEAGMRSAQRAAAAPAATGGDRAGSATASAIVGLLLMIAVAVFALRTLARRGRKAALARGGTRDVDPGAASFDQRVAARLRELDAAPVATAPAPTAFAPRPRTFGRRASA